MLIWVLPDIIKAHVIFFSPITDVKILFRRDDLVHLFVQLMCCCPGADKYMVNNKVECILMKMAHYRVK